MVWELGFDCSSTALRLLRPTVWWPAVSRWNRERRSEHTIRGSPRARWRRLLRAMFFWLKKFIAFWLMPLPFCLTAMLVGLLLTFSKKRARLGRGILIGA